MIQVLSWSHTVSLNHTRERSGRTYSKKVFKLTSYRGLREFFTNVDQIISTEVSISGSRTTLMSSKIPSPIFDGVTPEQLILCSNFI